MNERYQRLKKTLIANGIKGGIIIAGCGLLLGATIFFYQNGADDLKKLKNKERQSQSQIRQLKERNERTKNTMELYEKLVRDSELRDLVLNRKNISQLLDRLKEKYRLSDVSIIISPLTEQLEDPFVQKTGIVVTGDISIEMRALSDAHVFAFTKELLREFSGYLNVQSLVINRQGSISEELLREILQQGHSEFVTASLKFEWMGLRPKPNATAGGVP